MSASESQYVDLSGSSVSESQINNSSVSTINDEDANNNSCSPCNNNKTSSILCLQFNQNGSCFACGTDQGLRIYDCNSLAELFRGESALDFGGIAIAEMLFSTDLFGFVGNGQNPRYPQNKVVIWDHSMRRLLCDLCPGGEVRALRLTRDKIIVVTLHNVYVHSFRDLKSLKKFSTFENPDGLCVVSHDAANCVIAFPCLVKGQVRVELISQDRTQFVTAHDSELGCLALTLDGSILATASVKGTVIRVFRTTDGSKLHEFRRGAYRVQIYSLAFSINKQWLAVTSDAGTVHVFNLSQETPEKIEGKKVEGNGSYLKSPISLVKGVLPNYFNSRTSFALFHLPISKRHLVTFGDSHTVLIISQCGSFYRCAFDPVHGGQMTQKEYGNFLRDNASK